ncbi:MAG: DUF4365 domain-containing protein [Gemmataceae bacterium]
MTADDIGDQGQLTCWSLFTAACGRDMPYFRPRFLGDKYPTFDFIVEVVDRPEYYFFLQVKATTQGYSTNPRRLRVKVGQDDIDRMIACPAPAYLVGVDLMQQGCGFLLSVNEPRRQVASLPTRFRIDCGLLAELRDEVVAFWSARDNLLRGSRFHE